MKIGGGGGCFVASGGYYIIFTLLVLFIGGPSLFGNGRGRSGVDARRHFTYLNKWYKVACIAEHLKVGT